MILYKYPNAETFVCKLQSGPSLKLKSSDGLTQPLIPLLTPLSFHETVPLKYLKTYLGWGHCLCWSAWWLLPRYVYFYKEQPHKEISKFESKIENNLFTLHHHEFKSIKLKKDINCLKVREVTFQKFTYVKTNVGS